MLRRDRLFVFFAEDKTRGEIAPPARHASHQKTSKGHDTRALQAYLGHKNIQHTVRYTELAPHRFKYFWRKVIIAGIGDHAGSVRAIPL
jgi:S-formylglutathione hydrolase FrmB